MGVAKPAHIGLTFLSPKINPSLRRSLARRRPDIVMVQRERGHTTIHLIEIKYGRDNWPEDQEQQQRRVRFAAGHQPQVRA